MEIFYRQCLASPDQALLYINCYGLYAMDVTGLINSVEVLQPRRIYPIHSSGWNHFSWKEGEIRQFKILILLVIHIIFKFAE